MLSELLTMREQVAKAVNRACEIAAAGGGAGSSEMVSKSDYDELAAENKRLKYRIVTLNRSLDEMDGGY
jgi:hypothetical protein